MNNTTYYIYFTNQLALISCATEEMYDAAMFNFFVFFLFHNSFSTEDLKLISLWKLMLIFQKMKYTKLTHQYVKFGLYYLFSIQYIHIWNISNKKKGLKSIYFSWLCVWSVITYNNKWGIIAYKFGKIWLPIFKSWIDVSCHS